MLHHYMIVSGFLTMIVAPCLMAINAGHEELAGYDDEEEAC